MPLFRLKHAYYRYNMNIVLGDQPLLDERVYSYTQTINVSKPGILHSQKYRTPLEIHWINLNSIIQQSACKPG